MNIELNIEQVIANALSEALNPERLAEKIKVEAAKAADKAIEEAVNGYRSEFPKTIKAAVEKMLPHELSLDGQANWNHAIGQYLSQRLAAMHDQRIEQAVKPMLDKVLATPPAELKVSELVEKAIECWAEDASRERESNPTIIVEHSSGVVAGYWHLFMDKASHTSQYSCAVQIAVNDKGEVYGVKVDGKDPMKQRFAGPFFDFDAYLFQIYTGGTKLILDREDFDDVYYPGYDE